MVEPLLKKLSNELKATQDVLYGIIGAFDSYMEVLLEELDKLESSQNED